ncbi:MAG: YkgJ family cysteine cluster protein [Peptococcaceae bacterium]|jgi:Fe-S-cluster containining protein|nr:YkgJ family cysteine cluster protein [Peptococcaceae bacterium]MDH7525721.1 YkgJ family cysteine cluster protein [Peptococcaceae bacterium]
MSKGRVEVVPYRKNGIKGLDIRVCDEGASVDDYCAALGDYILTADFDRLRARKSSCEGCDVCCRERMPLTSVDVLTMHKKLAPALDFAELLRRFTYIAVSGRSVDIVLARDYEGDCIFLDKKKKRCLHYQQRLLVCRTYICTACSPRAAKLREAVVNTGEDELVRLWIAAGGTEAAIHEADAPDVQAADWPENAWTGKAEFSDILLVDMVTPELWTELCGKGESDV